MNIMNEKPASWNNISRNKVPDIWNPSNIDLSSETWTKQTELPDIWNANRQLPDNWSSYSSDSPTTWNVSGMLFDKWGRGGLLPENWKNSGPIPYHNDRSERHMPTNSRAGNISNIADRAQKAVGKVAGAHAAAAKLTGGALSKLSKKAVDYARSDDAAEKIDLAKGKVSAAFTGIKSKASAFASEHKRSVNEVSADIDEEIATEEISNISDDIDINEEFTESEEYTALDNSEIISDEENYDYDEDEELSEYQDEESFENDEYDVPDDSEIISADEGQYFEENIDEDDYEESNSNRMSYSDYAPQNVHYAADKKSHVVYVLTGVIAVLLVTAGVLGGMLIMKNKGDYNKDKYIFVESSVNENIAIETNVNENAETEAPDITTAATTETITESTTEKPEVLIVQDDEKVYAALDQTLNNFYVEGGEFRNTENMYIYSNSKFNEINIWLCDIKISSSENMIQNIGYEGATCYTFYKLNNSNFLDVIVELKYYEQQYYYNNTKITEYEFNDTLASFDEFEWIIPAFIPFTPLNKVEVVDVYSCNYFGKINTHGLGVTGFATSYVIDGGEVEEIRHRLGDWHVKAVNWCYTKDVLWYELYDADDGDYYGWVDAEYIDFNDSSSYSEYTDKSNLIATGKVITEKDDLNMRKSDSASSEIITTIPKDHYVGIISEYGDWLYVKYYADTNSPIYYGYVSKQFIEITESYGNE